jgi:hypothetical protein
MNSDSKKIWEVMNDLEMVTSKICSAREIIDSVAESIQKNDYDKAETLAMAAYEFLGYYLEEFDDKFKKAWKETVVPQKPVDDGMRPWGHSDLEYQIANKDTSILQCDKDDPSPECQKSWNDFWEQNYYPEEYEKGKVKKWVLPVEEVRDEDTDEDIYCVTFPDDLLEAANLKEGDLIEWVDQGDGSYRLEKVPKAIRMDEC